MSKEKETVVVSNGSGGPGWFVAALLVIVLAVVGYAIYAGVLAPQSNTVSVELKVPEGLTPSN